LESNIGKRELRKKTLLTAVPLKINLGDVGKIKLPVPSLSEQNRIVEILDTFTASIDNLKEQIALRRKQYEYYRDQLLDLEGKEGVEMKMLGEVCDISAGGDVPKDNMNKTKTDVFCIPIVSNGVGEKSIYGYTDLKKISRTSVTVAARGTIGYAEYRDYPYYPIVRLISVTPSVDQINVRYLYYLLSKQKYKIPKSGIPQLTVPVICKVRFPLPPLQEQQRIVSILDTFETSIQNLEAQLVQREKQYEYYRNKLLTFE
jgi:type I restriction enzyme S subunit